MEVRTFFGTVVRQRKAAASPRVVVFAATAGDVLQWAAIRRVDEEPRGIQRVLREARVKAIVRFLGADDRNVIPNAVTVAFHVGRADVEERALTRLKVTPVPNVSHATISFKFDPKGPQAKRPALVVDGQHRLNGVSQFDANAPITVVALIDATLDEQAFQFIVINNKAVRVPTENVKSILADFDEEALSDRLKCAGIRYGAVSPTLAEVDTLAESPFRGLLQWPRNRDGERVVPVTAIEQCLRTASAQFAFLAEEHDDDSLVAVFIAIWRGVRGAFPKQWAGGSKLMTKVSIVAVNEYVTERLKVAWEMNLVDVFDEAEVRSKSLELLRRIPEKFWSRKWSIPIQDNANVRVKIKEALDKVSANVRLQEQWDSGVELFDEDV